MGAEEVQCRSDSKLTVGHLTGEFQVNNDIIIQYCHKVVNLLSAFKTTKVEHIRREQNARADLLSKLASTKNKNHYNSMIQMMIPAPSINPWKRSHGRIDRQRILDDSNNWFLKNGTCEEVEKETMKYKCTRYTLIGVELYRRSFSRPLLKCIDKTQVE